MKGWEKEYERWRDMGHTWGPGVDDPLEYTEEERREEDRRFNAYQQKLESYRVTPRPDYLAAGLALKASLPDHKSITYGTAPFHWREDYSKAQIVLCREAAQTLGYSLCPRQGAFRTSGQFALQIEQYGFLPDRGGNIHPYIVSGITNLEDCLQLTADFIATGQHPTIFFDHSFLISCDDTGQLRMELENWSRSNHIPLPQKPSQSFQHKLMSASMQAEQNISLTRKTGSTINTNYPDREEER